MNVFFDTSSLFKLYHKENGTQDLIDFFNNNKIDSIFLSEVTSIEFSSVVWKKCRKKDINEIIANTLIEKFDIDSFKFCFVPYTIQLRNSAKNLIRKYWVKGLRTLDSIQLASCLTIDSDIEYFFTSDLILYEIASLEGFKVL